MHKLFTVCTEKLRSPYFEHAASGLPNPSHLEGEERFDQAQDQQVVTTRNHRIVTECLLTRSRSLISIFVVRCLDSVVSLVSISEISILSLASVAQHLFESYLVAKPEDKFCHEAAQLNHLQEVPQSNIAAFLWH